MQPEIQPPESNYPRKEPMTLQKVLDFRDGYRGVQRALFMSFAITGMMSLLAFQFDGTTARLAVATSAALAWTLIIVRNRSPFEQLFGYRKTWDAMPNIVFAALGLLFFTKQEYKLAIAMWAFTHVWLHVVARQALHGMGVSQRVLFVKREEIEI